MIVVDAMMLAYFLLRHPRFTDSVDRRRIWTRAS
jgi:hypothetical protein